MLQTLTKGTMVDCFLIPEEDLIMVLLDWDIAFWNLVIEIYKNITKAIKI